MQDSNLRERNPSDFKSDALTTRPICLDGLPSIYLLIKSLSSLKQDFYTYDTNTQFQL